MVIKKTQSQIQDEKFAAERRKERMDSLETRIAQTPSGERFLDRLYKIKKIEPLHPDDTKESE